MPRFTPETVLEITVEVEDETSDGVHDRGLELQTPSILDGHLLHVHVHPSPRAAVENLLVLTLTGVAGVLQIDMKDTVDAAVTATPGHLHIHQDGRHHRGEVLYVVVVRTTVAVLVRGACQVPAA